MKKNLLVLDADYFVEDDRGVVRLFCKDKNGNSVMILDSDFEPYFYVLPKKENLWKKIESFDFGDAGKLKRLEEVEKILDGKKTKLLKIIVENPRNVPKIRDVIKEWEEVEQEYEYTVPFVERYFLDKKIEPMGWISVDGEKIENKNKSLVDEIIMARRVTKIDRDEEVDFRILAFDLELVGEGKEEKIIMISLNDNKGLKKVLATHEWKSAQKYVQFVEDERTMIETFIQTVKERDPDFICSYNGDAFDFMKLRERSTKLKISLKLGRDSEPVKFVRRGRVSSAEIRGRIHIDLYKFIDHILSPSMKTEVLTLDAVAQELLGFGKKDVKWKEIKESWSKKEDLEKVADYAIRDAELTLMLANQLLPQIFSLSSLTGSLPFDTSRYYYSQLVESFLTRKAVETNVVIPNRPKYEEIQERKRLPVYKGAIVIEPKKGIHSDILVFDFQSLYPTIIVTHNISPETLNCKCCKENRVPELGYHFCTKKKGFIPAHLEDIIKKRREIKEKMKKLKKGSDEYNRLNNYQYALKIIANASYGYGGYVGARWYCRECAESTTAWGRYYISKVLEIAKSSGFQVLYADTDSCMATLGKMEKGELIKKAEKFEEKVNKQLPGIIELEFRGLYQGGIFVTRKEGDKGAKKRYALIDYDGNMEIRGFEAIRTDWCDLSKNIQHEILRIILQDKDPEKAMKMVRNTIKKIQEGKVSLDELTIHTQLTMPLSAYKQIGPHVKVAQKMRQRGRPVGEGMIIEFIITKDGGSISDRAEPFEDVREGGYDPDYYINHQVLPAAMRVLSALGITEEALKGKTQTKLGKWFER